MKRKFIGKKKINKKKHPVFGNHLKSLSLQIIDQFKQPIAVFA